MAARIGIMGGTFDPLHNGHIACAQAARDALGLDEVLFVPSGMPSFKQGTVQASAADRLAMARLGIDGIEGFAVDELEVERPGVTYTVDTLERLSEQFGPDADLVFITGADAARDLPAWDRPERLAQLADFAVVERAGEGLSAEEAAQLADAGFRVLSVDAETPPVSSSEIRRRVREGLPIDGMVPKGVERYLMENDLYGAQEDALSDEFYQARKAELAGRVGEKRFEHSKGVAKTAAKLARAYGVDERKARLAGILHDWDKAYDDAAELARVEELGVRIDDELRALPRLLHGMTAAAALRRDYPSIPDDVLQAVHNHTIADENMSDLDMVVYIADALEPHREGKSTDELRALVGEVPLRELFLCTYAHLLSAMLKRRKRLYSRTVGIWNAYMDEEGNYCAAPGADPFPQAVD